MYARPNPKYFGRRGGATWLNMINDQAAGLGGKVVAGTPRDSLYVLDVLYDRDGGKRPEMIVTDTASYSDIVFGLLTLAGFAYAPQLADLPDQKMWRIDRAADYGACQDAARGRVDLARIERHWEDILRIIGSIHTGAVRAYDVIRMLSRDGRPTPLGDAIAHYGRIAKTPHILRLADEPGYRRQIKSQANLQEGRHTLARKIFHGRSGQLYQRYQDGMEDQIGALGPVLNALVLFNARYMDAAARSPGVGDMGLRRWPQAVGAVLRAGAARQGCRVDGVLVDCAFCSCLVVADQLASSFRPSSAAVLGGPL